LLSTARLICARIQWRQIFGASRRTGSWSDFSLSCSRAWLITAGSMGRAADVRARHHLFGSDKFIGQKVYGRAQLAPSWPLNFSPPNRSRGRNHGARPISPVSSKLCTRVAPARLRRYCRCACLLILMQPDLGEVIIWCRCCWPCSSSAEMPLRYLILHSFNSVRHDSNHGESWCSSLINRRG